jgi:hypothetical protein
MRYILAVWDLVTRDPLALAASGALALALLLLVAVLLWPSRRRPSGATTGGMRSAHARALAAAGVTESDIARRTGLSRDALALVRGATRPAARQKAPSSARFSLFRRSTPPVTAAVTHRQVPV